MVVSEKVNRGTFFNYFFYRFRFIFSPPPGKM